MSIVRRGYVRPFEVTYRLADGTRRMRGFDSREEADKWADECNRLDPGSLVREEFAVENTEDGAISVHIPRVNVSVQTAKRVEAAINRILNTQVMHVAYHSGTDNGNDEELYQIILEMFDNEEWLRESYTDDPRLPESDNITLTLFSVVRDDVEFWVLVSENPESFVLYQYPDHGAAITDYEQSVRNLVVVGAVLEADFEVPGFEYKSSEGGYFRYNTL
ncbi:hypothetical protein FDA94_28735 [Herbidospora galbida]|uniref:Uncharacterized protein n=1 Tax=Herbidospora galbida TaxID=2575442 RepID=A0A4U3M6Q7_9ACTN|nr:hypothetical protein [Herbidospora galbida]TKK84618.1 hypothetical protein FDA94_28735 [Herbidospora galbida]